MSGLLLEDLVAEQLAFYRADAPAYEAWRVEVFERGGGGEKGAAVRRDERRALSALERFAPRGRVLELAAGTGRYTPALLACAEHVTAVDGSPESLRIARVRLAPDAAAGRLALVEVDLFRWQPQERYDCVFFGYWLSHVPPRRLDAFWRMVGDALAPGGRVFFVDSAGGPRLASPPLPGGPSYREIQRERHLSVRHLGGRRYRVVKVEWEPAGLEERLAALGWAASIERGELALWGSARPAGGSASRRREPGD